MYKYNINVIEMLLGTMMPRPEEEMYVCSYHVTDYRWTMILTHTDKNLYLNLSGIETGGSGGSMNRGPWAPGGPE